MKRIGLFAIFLIIAISTQAQNYKLIIGKWQNTADNSEIWDFNDTYLKIKSTHENIETKYGITNKCINDEDTPNEQDDKYINTYENDCYYIINLDNNLMELSLVGSANGNTLKFKKITAENKTAIQKIDNDFTIENISWAKAVKSKVYFYSKADKATLKTSYIIKNDEVAVSANKETKDFYYVLYTTKTGKEIKGFMLKTDLEIKETSYN